MSQNKKPADSRNPQIILETNMGNIRVELFHDKAPLTVENFLRYVEAGFYEGTLFHRVIDGFMIQGGGFNSGMEQKESYPPIKNEADNGIANSRGTVAMARTQIVDSATSEFFINLVDNTYLDHHNDTPAGYGYCVFGRVAEGMEVVDRIAKVPTHSFRFFQDVPVDEIIINKLQQVPSVSNS